MTLLMMIIVLIHLCCWVFLIKIYQNIDEYNIIDTRSETLDQVVIWILILFIPWYIITKQIVWEYKQYRKDI